MKKISLLLIMLMLLSTPLIPIVDSTPKQVHENTFPHFHQYSTDLFETISTENQYSTKELTNIALSINKSFTITLDDINFQKTKTNQFSISISNSTVLNQPGLPLIPMKTIRFTLPKNAMIQTINLHNCSIQKSTKSLLFQQTPNPQFWNLNETPLHTHTSEIIQNTIHQAQQKKIYPGQPYSYTRGKNKTHTNILLQIFPIQYHFDTKETFLINQGTIKVSYILSSNQKNEESLINSSTESIENIIISPPLFNSQAQKLKQFHTNNGINTEVFSTSWIETNFEPSSYPPVMGYKNYSITNQIRKYDDTLALKIISFLQSQSTNPDLQFVTIFGNGIHIPPSYYFGHDYYPVPTDFYYSSPDLDLIPNYRIGRLPANNLLEARRTVNKIINWNPTTHQMDNIAIAGGIPFNSPFYIGELITTDSMNRGLFDGLNVDKYFRTDERFEKSDITSTLQNDYGLLYMICHGNTNLVAVEPGRISAKDLARLPKNNNAPIISCIACSSGSYDTHVIRQGYSLDKTSFGEATVVSKGGGIAYIGGSRTNDGYPILTLNNGRVEIEKETYMAGLLTYVNQAYKNNVNHLGDLTQFAAERYLTKNDMTDFWNQYHYFSFVLLGDPALQLPDRLFQQETYQQPITSADNPITSIPYASNDYNGSISLHALDEQMMYETKSDSPFINVKHIKTGDYQNVEVETSTHSSQNNQATINLNPISASLSLLRFETKDGKEDWLYYKGSRPVNKHFTLDTPGFNHTRFNTIQQAINQAQPNDLIYVLNGTYNESITITIPCIIQGENKSTTIIDGSGNKDVISILSDGVSISDFTTQHCGKNPWNAAVSIQPKKSLNSQPIIIENNKIQNNKNCGIYIDVPNPLLTPSIIISGNDISYNNFGVFIQNGANNEDIVSNTIYGNNYGIYMLNAKQNMIVGNGIENNYIGLFLKDVKRTSITSNNFIENTQHCQFSETRFTKFNSNYWDDWIGHLFNRQLPIPKVINGIHDNSKNLLSQLKIDFQPVKEPILN